MEATSHAASRWAAVTAIAPVAWGANYYVTRQFLPPGDPLYGAALRALPAGLLLLLSRRLPRGDWWWKSAVLGSLNCSIFFVLIYVASQRLPTHSASTVMALSPLAMALAAWALLGERPQRVQVAGALTGLAGVCLMVLPGAGPSADAWGLLSSAAAMTASSLGYVLAKRWGSDVPVLASTAWQLTVGGLLLLPAAVALEGAPPAIDARSGPAFAYCALIATAAAFVAWFAGLRHLPAGTVGLVGLLNPVTGVLLGTLAAGEAFGPAQGFGMVLIFGGIVIGRPGRAATRGRGSRARLDALSTAVIGAGQANPARAAAAEAPELCPRP